MQRAKQPSPVQSYERQESIPRSTKTLFKLSMQASQKQWIKKTEKHDISSTDPGQKPDRGQKPTCNRSKPGAAWTTRALHAPSRNPNSPGHRNHEFHRS